MKDNKEIYKVAVIGCGWIAEDKHIPGLKANKDVEIVALCDISVEKANRLAKMYELTDVAIYSDYRKMLADEKEMILSVCKNQQEQELMKSCIYAYCYPAQMVLKSFNDRDKKK